MNPPQNTSFLPVLGQVGYPCILYKVALLGFPSNGSAPVGPPGSINDCILRSLLTPEGHMNYVRMRGHILIEKKSDWWCDPLTGLGYIILSRFKK